MSSEIICNITGQETRLALTEQGQLTELHIHRGNQRGFVGNVYLGKVVRVLPGMQAAFVDIGLDRAAFLYVGDIVADTLHLDDGSPPEPPRPKASQPPIQDLITEGQTLVVQVSKDPIGTKGARVTTHVALPGRFMVFMPTVDHIGISKRIASGRERKRLRQFVQSHRKPGMGFIVRTVSAQQPTESLQADMDFLTTIWERIVGLADKQSAPSLLHAEFGLVLRAIRDVMDDSIARVVIDDNALYDQVTQMMSQLMPSFTSRVHYYRGKEPVFDTFAVEPQIQRSLGRKVWLKSGGYLVIDQTEALIAIDVNSGKFVGKSSLEETTLQINLEAAKEVVYQLRLRNIGGLIIIDFIDMRREADRQKVYAYLEDALRQDRSRTNVLRISELGLVEMTRKRTQEGLDRFLMETCAMCEGTGVVRAKATVAYDMFRAIQREALRAEATATLFVNTTPDIADLVYGELYDDLTAIEQTIQRPIVVRPMADYHPEQYTVYAQ